VWVAGGYERRGVMLQNESGEPRSINAVPGTGESFAFVDVEGARLSKRVSGLRLEWKAEATGGIDPGGYPRKYLAFADHLGTASVVTDFDTGDVVEWRSNTAYGADESVWKSIKEEHDGLEEPYGFTGKEEDEEVGLWYFGARYYSAYTARWLSPDPVTTHEGAIENYYRYGASSPYIAVDPDGAWVEWLVVAIVGSVIGSTNEAIKRGGINSAEDAGWVLLAGVRGAGMACAAYANPFLGAAAATGDQQLQMLYDSGGDTGILVQPEFHKQSAIVFGSSLASSYAGRGLGMIGPGGSSSVGGTIYNAASSYVVGVGVAATNQMVSTGEGLRGEDWERMVTDQAISSAQSFAGSVIGSEVRSGLTDGGGGGEKNNSQTSAQQTNANAPSNPSTVGQQCTSGAQNIIADAPNHRLVDSNGQDYTVYTLGNDIYIMLPVRFTGPGATAQNVAMYRKYIQDTWSGQIGQYNVTTILTTPSSPTGGNEIVIENGRGTAYTEPENNRARVFAGEYGNIEASSHEVGHLLGLTDQYRDTYSCINGRWQRFSRPLPLGQGNIMATLGERPSALDIYRIMQGHVRNNEWESP